MAEYRVAALYKFVDLPDFAELKPSLLAYCQTQQVKGTILLAAEGINGTIAGLPEQVQAVLAYLRCDPRFADLTAKQSFAPEQPFPRLKVRLKQEIVTMGVPGLNPAQMAGKYVKPEAWNALLNDPDVVVIDARNDYEVAIGTFKGAIDPQTKSFSELPNWLLENVAAPEGSFSGKPKVAMFCTGGIRCEKSTAFLRSQGFAEVYHLEGGILKYLETIPESESLWQGECFVFDERVSVVHGVQPGSYDLCRACGQPVSPADKTSLLYVQNLSCPHCYGQKTTAQLQGLTERKRQIELAQSRKTDDNNPVRLAVSHKPLKNAPMVANTLPILYSFRRCPYAMRARMALIVSGQVCELREVVLRDKPQEMLAASPKGTVPVLIKPDGQVLDQSLEIMLWALQQHDPQQWLSTQGTQGTVADMLALIAEFDQGFKYHLDRYKYAERYENTDALTHRTAGALYLEKLNAQLTKTAYLFGDHNTLADMAIVPFVRQFAIANQAWFNAQPWPDLQAWLTNWLDSELYSGIMEKYPQWVSGRVGVMFGA